MMRDTTTSHSTSSPSGSAIPTGSAAIARQRLQVALQHDRPERAAPPTFTARRPASTVTPILRTPQLQPTSEACPSAHLLALLLTEPLSPEGGECEQTPLLLPSV